jgi:transposase
VIDAFAKSQMSRTKTDKVDAKLIARFCQERRPPVWSPPPVEIRTLQALVRRLDALLEMHQMEKNRLLALAGISAEAVRTSVQEHLDYLDQEIKRTRGRIKDHIDQNPTLLPPRTHHPVGKEMGKETGETNHVERSNNTLRQRLGCLVRKTLSFSTSRYWHAIRIRLFLLRYNRERRDAYLALNPASA